MFFLLRNPGNRLHGSGKEYGWLGRHFLAMAVGGVIHCKKSRRRCPPLRGWFVEEVTG